MRIEEYSRHLEMLAQQYIGKYLDAGSKDILIDKARLLGRIPQKIKKRHSEWSLVITPEKPLTFIKNDVDDLKLQIDLSCDIEGAHDDVSKIKKSNIILRVWSYDEKICYREGFDAKELKNKMESLGWRRVITRFHFDMRNADAREIEPLYHFHIGGISNVDEYCWLPEKIKVPRFCYPPMDLILLCEFVLMNFFPDDYEELRKKPEWKSLVKKSQEIFMKSYLESCVGYLNNDTDTILGKLVT